MNTVKEADDALTGKDTQYLLKDEGIIYGTISKNDVDWYKHVLTDPRGYDYIFKASKDGALGGLDEFNFHGYDNRTNLAVSVAGGAGNPAIFWWFDIENKTREVVYSSIDGGSGTGTGTGDYKIEVVREVAANEYTRAKLSLDE